MSPARTDTPLRILGIDPGTRIVGVGVLDIVRGQPSFVACGAIRAKAGAPMANRLLEIYTGLEAFMALHRPDVVALESAFVGKNFASALAMGQARGIALLCAARAGLPLFEYPPATVKRAIAGFGAADKAQLSHWIARLLNLREPPEPHDASDALAIALTHVHRRPTDVLRAAIEGTTP